MSVLSPVTRHRDTGEGESAYRGAYLRGGVGLFQQGNLSRWGMISPLPPHGTLTVRPELLSLAARLSVFRPLSISPSPAPASFPHQLGNSCHNLPCTLRLPSPQDGLLSSICLGIPSYSLKLSSGVTFLGAISPKHPYPSWASGLWRVC